MMRLLARIVSALSASAQDLPSEGPAYVPGLEEAAMWDTDATWDGGAETSSDAALQPGRPREAQHAA